MSDAATQTAQGTPASATQPAPTGGATDGFAPAVSGAMELVGETFRLGGATARAAADVVSGGAGPALVLLAAGFAAAVWMRRR